MACGVNDAVHVKVQIVVLNPVGIRLRRIGVDARAPDIRWHGLDGVDYCLWIPLAEPSIKTRDPHR